MNSLTQQQRPSYQLLNGQWLTHTPLPEGLV